MRPPNDRRNRRVAGMALGAAFGMLGLAYASVPLYEIFCQVTGFGGTTQRAEHAPADVRTETITVKFDSNIAASLGWTFRSVQQAMTVRIGEQNMAHYRATNTSNRPLTGSATFNVTPVTAGTYFNKIQCFCFTEQTLQPGETVDMPVVFFVDPDVLEDPDTRSIKEITLSYTFYPVEKSKNLSAAAIAAGPVN